MTSLVDVSPEELLEWAKLDFKTALAAMPFGQERLAQGQQFNAFESAANDEDDDPADWEYYLSLGPITDCVLIMGIEGEWRAKLIEAALRVALRGLTAEQAKDAEIERLRSGVQRILDRMRDDTSNGMAWLTYAEVQEYRREFDTILNKREGDNATG